MWSILRWAWRWLGVFRQSERKDVLSKASPAYLQEIPRRSRYADLHRARHAESERKDVLTDHPDS